jgi:2',3'-cyclic-nucleotide 2'-phosphodiesterase (5'-nucleotidase family)
MHNRRCLFRVFPLLGLAVAAACAPHPTEPAPDAVREITLLYTNDFESAYDPIEAFWRDDLEYVGGVAQLAALIERIRRDEDTTFLLDAGDIFTGTLAKLTRGELSFELMTTMGYDAMCIGNHEFEYGWWVLRDSMQRAPFPVLAANLYYEGTDIPFTQRWTILERDGYRVGVFGIFGLDAATALYPPHIEGLEVRDPVATALAIVEKIRPDVDLVVALTHQGKTAPMQTDDEADATVHRGIEADIALAGAVAGIDVLIGGHADAGQEKPVIHPVTGTLICQTYGQGTRLGYLKLLVDPDTHTIAGHDGRLLVVAGNELEPHPVVASKLAAYRARFPEVYEVIGRSGERLTRRYNEESDLGNLFADILLDYGRTDVAFVHSGGIRADLPAGEVTREDLLDAFPFIDYVVTLRMTGAEIIDVLEQSFSLERGVLQVSGITVTYDVERPVGERVVAVDIGGEPLVESARYTVTTFDFLASGADLYSGFLGAETIDADGPEFAELLLGRFAMGEPVARPERGRLIPVS